MADDTSFADAPDDGGPSGLLPANFLPNVVPRTVSGRDLTGGGDNPRGDNPTPQLVPPPTHAVSGTIGEKHVLVMVRPQRVAAWGRLCCRP